MADYFGTDEDDLIDASTLDSDVDKIYPGKGNDKIINAKFGQSVVASPGEDDISGQGYGYALWDSPQGGTVNLKEGWADDGFGTRDTISGVSTVLGSGKSDKFIGTSSYEHFFPGNGNDIIDGGGGDDKVTYYDKNSSDYEISQVGDEFHIQQLNGFLPTLDKVKDVRFIEFTGDNKIVDLNYYDAELKAKLIKKLHSFEDDSVTASYTYSNKFYPEAQVNYSPQGTYVLDINNDGIKDVVFPMFKAYATGSDTSTAYIALTSYNGSLIFDEEINATMPISSGSRRSEGIKLVNSEYPAFVTVNHNTDREDNRDNPDSVVPPSELNIVQSVFSTIKQSNIIPTLPNSTEKHPFAVDAHSMGVGDINGDGLDDIFVGHWTGEKAYALIQGEDGVFTKEEQDLYKEIINWPSETTRQNFNILRDAGLVDVNGDGYDDLIAGFGYGGSPTTIFINNKGLFSSDNKIELPASIYGNHNQMSSKIMDADFDHDGDIDIAMLQIQLGDDPVNGYYAGNYIQILRNDGNGNYEDITNYIPENATMDAYLQRLNWNEPWQLIDLNNDNHIDIAGARAAYTGTPLIYLNDGEGRFEIKEIFLNEAEGRIYAYGDFNGNNKIELISFIQKNSLFEFYLFELTDIIGTGPNSSNTTADQGAPGFNERYYLNENSSAKEAVDAGTYTTGLEHYLAEGKEAGLKTFAPFTKVHGYSGDDNIVLYEGDEIALGYGGNDSIEGGAGNDTIDGGAGSDTAVFRDTYESYTLTYNDDDSLTVKHNPSSSDQIDEGTDTLTNIEKLQFSDLTTSAIQSKYSLSSALDSSKKVLEPFSETSKSGTLNFSSGNNIIVADGQAKTLRGLDGDDTYFVSNLLPKNSSIEIIDTSGSNTIQIAANTKVVKTLWTKDATRLTFEDDKVITINGADNFTFNMGGNVTNGTDGVDLTFAEFALSFGIDDVLNLSGSDTGTITDLYII